MFRKAKEVTHTATVGQVAPGGLEGCPLCLQIPKSFADPKTTYRSPKCWQTAQNTKNSTAQNASLNKHPLDILTIKAGS